jgi:virginiamycin B lyase
MTEVSAPQAPQGGIAVGGDGAVYMNGSTAFMRYAGSFATYAYPIPDTSVVAAAGVNTLARGPGGTIWTILSAVVNGPITGIIAALSPSGGMVAESQLDALIAPGDTFIALASGPAGTMWLATLPRSLTISPEGRDYILIANASLNSTATTQTSAITIFAMALGPDGAMYVASDPSSGFAPVPVPSQIFRIDPSTRNTLNTTTLPAGSRVTQLTAGPDGAVWFTDTGLNKIGRLATSGAVTYYSVPTANSGLSGIAAASDRALWFTETNANKIGRIDTAGHINEYAIPTPNSQPIGIDAGAPGGCVPQTVYFTEKSALGKLVFAR